METDKVRKEIKARFFEALDALKARKVIRGVGTFANMHGINPSNLRFLRYKENGTVNSEYLYYIIMDFGVNPKWLITGVGEMFKHDNFAKSE